MSPRYNSYDRNRNRDRYIVQDRHDDSTRTRLYETFEDINRTLYQVPYQPQAQIPYQPQNQIPYQTVYQPHAQIPYQPQPQTVYQPQPQTVYQPQPQIPYQRVYQPQPQAPYQNVYQPHNQNPYEAMYSTAFQPPIQVEYDLATQDHKIYRENMDNQKQFAELQEELIKLDPSQCNKKEETQDMFKQWHAWQTWAKELKIVTLEKWHEFSQNKIYKLNKDDTTAWQNFEKWNNSKNLEMWRVFKMWQLYRNGMLGQTSNESINLMTTQAWQGWQMWLNWKNPPKLYGVLNKICERCTHGMISALSKPECDGEIIGICAILSSSKKCVYFHVINEESIAFIPVDNMKLDTEMQTVIDSVTTSDLDKLKIYVSFHHCQQCGFGRAMRFIEIFAKFGTLFTPLDDVIIIQTE